jgi:Ras-related C3 botulinum toxin substrate 1
LAYPQADIFLICFSLNKSTSLKNLALKFIPEIRLHSEAPMVLVGTKLDSQTKKLEEVQRNRDEALKLKENVVEDYVECSAFSSVGVAEVFETAVRVATEKKIIKVGAETEKCEILSSNSAVFTKSY